MAGQKIDGNFLTATAGEAMSSLYLRVKLSSYTAGSPPTIAIAGVTAEDDIGVTRTVAASGDEIGVELYGKAGTMLFNASAAISAGALIYPAASGKVSSTAVGEPIGYALELADGSGSIFEALVFPRPRGPRKITDPGNAGAIPVTHSGACAITTAGAETRTLAAPTFDGQRLSISMDVDGGDGVLTVAAAINQTGNNTVTFNDAGDTIDLVAIRVAGVLRWKLVVNDGTSLSTV